MPHRSDGIAGLRNILCIHSSAELYGSDRSFASAVEMIVAKAQNAKLKVILPFAGPLTEHMPRGSVEIQDIWILRRGNLLADVTLRLCHNFKTIARAWREMRDTDLAYINTVTPASYLLAARFIRTPVIVHIREIPGRLERCIFRWMVLWTKGALVFNSETTKLAFSLPRHTRSYVVYNGVNDPLAAMPAPPAGSDRLLRVLLIGRINSWKGQQVLVSAIAKLSDEERSLIQVRIVGDCFAGQSHYAERLAKIIEDNGLNAVVSVDPFEASPTASYLNSDVVVVPSIRPEPFGRVAIEAMAAGKAVIASANGGLIEIVKDGVTGRHIRPGDALHLRDVLREFISDPTLAARLGAEGRLRYLELFTTERSSHALQQAFETELSMLTIRPHHRGASHLRAEIR